MAANLIPAAQYLRMSTENQQYSLQNQADAIGKYAADHGFEIVKTYSDAAKSGLRLQNRSGLKQLLKDVVEDQVGFGAVLDQSQRKQSLCGSRCSHYSVGYCLGRNAQRGSFPGVSRRTPRE